MSPLIRILASCALALACSSGAEAQQTTPAAATLVHSISQPPRWQPYAAGFAVRDRDTGPGLIVTAGVHRPLMNPVTGLLGAAAEVYGSAGSSFDGGGARLLARSQLLALSAGLDWNVGSGREGRIDVLLSYQSAIRRGGLLGHGTMLRLDWLPTRGRTLAAGIHVPVMQPLAGRTRPRDTGVWLGAPPPTSQSLTSGPLPADAVTALAAVDEAAARLRAYASLWSDQSQRRVLAGTYDSASRTYASSLARAFAAAAGDRRLGDVMATRARAGLLDYVILPYDSLFGQVKEPSGSIRPLALRAQDRFARWLTDTCSAPVSVRPAVLAVHARWLATIEKVHRDLLDEWNDSRMVWLPLPLALVPEQYDEQVEIDSLVARMVGRPFTDGNALTYLRSADLPLEIARSIYAARDYHVLWMHDFTGQRESGAVDDVSYEMVADVYLPALTAAVKRYDATGRLPLYMVLIDQFFYEPRNGRLWMSMLEDPLGSDMKLPGPEARREGYLRARQAELRAAVAASARLQREAAGAGGQAWLRRVVKVHVNVTQPSDFSFRSHRIVPPLPFTPDNIMRDHRKLVVYDVNESDPYRGATLLMGVGIGEHYASATWEDRGYRLRGPAALEVRAALVRALRQHGFADDDIPLALRPVRSTRAVERRMDQGDYVGRALQVHNEVGFGRKESSVVRAMLYDLALPGSTIIAPDPLWLSAEWGAMLAGAAARGAQVHVIAPAKENAPSPQAPLMALAHDVMRRLLEIQRRLAEPIRQSGGALRVGLFTARAEVNDVEGRRREVREGLRRAPWIRDVIPFDAAALAVLTRTEARVADDGPDATRMARDEQPRPQQLHQKTQLVARAGAIAVLVRQPGWEQALARAFETQSRQSARFAEQLGWETPAVEAEATRRTDAILEGYERSLTEAERKRVSFYFTVGTQNQDPRGLVQDGEATLVTSGFHSATGLVDLFHVMARSTWITSREELERYLPGPSGFMRLLSKLARPAF